MVNIQLTNADRTILCSKLAMSMQALLEMKMQLCSIFNKTMKTKHQQHMLSSKAPAMPLGAGSYLQEQKQQAEVLQPSWGPPLLHR